MQAGCKLFFGYPITPQTEIVEYVAKFPFSKGRVVPVESEHSAMGVTIGASLSGARAFTASSSNGIAYMVENIMVAGYYRLPVVMVAVGTHVGPRARLRLPLLNPLAADGTAPQV